MTSSLPTFRARTLFAPLEADGRAGTVARRLAQAISLGLLLDGERLPAESQLAVQFGVSPVTLRDALASLREMGLIETRRGRGGGSFIRAPGEARTAQLRDRIAGMSLHELRDICDHRAAVAGAAARLAAERALPADVAALREHAGAGRHGHPDRAAAGRCAVPRRGGGGRAVAPADPGGDEALVRGR